MIRNWEEGGNCPVCQSDSSVVYEPAEGCYCHISPPCGVCENLKLYCSECGYGERDDKQ